MSTLIISFFVLAIAVTVAMAFYHHWKSQEHAFLYGELDIDNTAIRQLEAFHTIHEKHFKMYVIILILLLFGAYLYFW